MTRSELAWGLAEVFTDLHSDEINQMLSKNVPLETLEFFGAYAESFTQKESLHTKRLSNMLIVGYLLRVLEERLLGEDDH